MCAVIGYLGVEPAVDGRDQRRVGGCISYLNAEAQLTCWGLTIRCRCANLRLHVRAEDSIQIIVAGARPAFGDGRALCLCAAICLLGCPGHARPCPCGSPLRLCGPASSPAAIASKDDPGRADYVEPVARPVRRTRSRRGSPDIRPCCWRSRRTIRAQSAHWLAALVDAPVGRAMAAPNGAARVQHLAGRASRKTAVSATHCSSSPHLLRFAFLVTSLIICVGKPAGAPHKHQDNGSA